MFEWNKHTKRLGFKYKCRLAGEQFFKWGEDHPWVKKYMTDQMNPEELETSRQFVEMLKREEKEGNYARRSHARPS